MLQITRCPVILRYSTRCYATVVNGSKKIYIPTLGKNDLDGIELNLLLRTIFDPSIDRSAVIKEFKLLVDSLNTSSNVLYEKKNNKQDLDIVKKLILNVLGPKYQYEINKTATLQTISRKLKTIIESNKISDKVIFQRITKFRETQPINVNIPLNAKKANTKTNLEKYDLQPSLSLSLGQTNNNDKNITSRTLATTEGRSDSSDDMNTFATTNKVNVTNKKNTQNDILEILDKLEIHLLNKNTNTNDLYQIFSNMLEETKPENLLGKHLQSPSDRDIINLDNLTSYLNKIETQEYQKKVVLKEQQRIYNWNKSITAMNKTNELILNDILSLFNPISWITSNKNRRIRSFWGTKSSNQIICTEYKIYDLQTNKTMNYDTKLERFPLNIDYKDMFEIINNAQLSPEVALSKLKNQQTDDWRLVGSLFNEPNKIIFKRMIKSNNTSYFSYILKGVFIVISCGIGYQTYTQFFGRKKEIKTEDVPKV